MITGAGGFLGSELLKQLKNNKNDTIFAFDLEKVKNTGSKNLISFDYQDWKHKKIPFNKINCIINCAFSRENKGSLLSDSLDFTKDLFLRAKSNLVNSVINISTQSVYGEPSKPLWTENTPVTNNNLYALAKYSTELLAESIFSEPNSHTSFSNLRMASLIGVGFDNRLTNKFIINAINNRPIKIVGGEQILAFMDIRDAAEAILSLINTNHKDWKKTFNLGSNKRHTLIEIAQIVKDTAKKYLKAPVQIDIENKNVNMETGMDSSLFYSVTGWKPKYNLEDTIDWIFCTYIKK